MSVLRRSILELPADAPTRVAALVEQSAPNLNRPKVNAKVDQELEASERKCAATYAAMEDTAVRLRQLATRIEREGMGVPLTFDDEDSAVHHIAELKEKAGQKID